MAALKEQVQSLLGYMTHCACDHKHGLWNKMKNNVHTNKHWICTENVQIVLQYDMFRISLLFTARVRSTTGGYLFTGICLLTRGYPSLWSQVPSQPLVPCPVWGLQQYWSHVPYMRCPSPVTGPAEGEYLRTSPPPAGTRIPPGYPLRLSWDWVCPPGTPRLCRRTCFFCLSFRSSYSRKLIRLYPMCKYLCFLVCWIQGN